MNDKALYELFGAREIMDLPAAVYKTLFADIKERDEIYRRLLELYNYDITYDWFQELYEIEYAQRKKKQDFTPHSVTEIVSCILGHSNISTTLNTYVHPDAQQKRDAIDSFFNKRRKSQ